MRIAILLLLILVGSAEAKTLYVNGSTGSDATTYTNNDSDNPWATIGRSAWGSTNRAVPNTSEAAQAGDTVIIAAGTYSAAAGSGARDTPAWNPANSGTSGNLITFQASGTVTLQKSTDTGPVIGTNSRDYIVWDGFTVDEPNINTQSDTGPAVIWSSDYVTIQNCTFIGKTAGWSSDNHSAIRLEYADNSTIYNNTFYGTRSSPSDAKGSVIMTYYTTNLLVEHNTIYDSSAGVYIKGGNEGPVTIRYNLFYDLDYSGIVLGGIGTASGSYGAEVYQNIIRDSNNAVTYIGFDSYSPANVSFVNNTIHNCSDGGAYLKTSTTGYSNLKFYNNLSIDNGYGILGVDISDVSETTFEYNMYHGNTTHANIGGTTYTFATWQSSLSKDAVDSSEADPLFNNEAGDDFTLSSSSPALDAGFDILDLDNDGLDNDDITIGAYITGDECIGVSCEEAAVSTGSFPLRQ